MQQHRFTRKWKWSQRWHDSHSRECHRYLNEIRGCNLRAQLTKNWTLCLHKERNANFKNKHEEKKPLHTCTQEINQKTFLTVQIVHVEADDEGYKEARHQSLQNVTTHKDKFVLFKSPTIRAVDTMRLRRSASSFGRGFSRALSLTIFCPALMLRYTHCTAASRGRMSRKPRKMAAWSPNLKVSGCEIKVIGKGSILNTTLLQGVF